MNLLLQSKLDSNIKQKKRRHSIGKYIVIDSQCDQEIIVKSQVGGKENRKEDGYYNLRTASYSLQLNKNAKKDEDEIKKAERLLAELQRQCLLLEKTIDEIIEEKAELMVNLRRKQRSRSHQKGQLSREKNCPVHSTYKTHQKDSMSNIIELKLSLLSSHSQTASQCNQQKMRVETLHQNQIKFKTNPQTSIPPSFLLGYDDKHQKAGYNAKLRRI